MLAELANAPWQVMEIYDDINYRWSYWKDLFLSIIDSHAPLVSVRMKVKNLSSEWIDAELRSLLRARNYYQRKYWKTRTQLDWDKYTSLRKEITTRMRRAKTAYYTAVCQNISQKPKATWNELNEVLGRKKKDPVSMLKCSERMLFKSDEIASSFRQYFGCTPLSTPTSSANTITPAQTTFKFQRISEETVMKKLATLDERKATGPDKISAKLLKMVAPSVAPSLTSLFKHSILSGQFPSEWKEANVIPVPKSGDKDLMSNYHPVSIIPVFAKVFEGLIHHQVYEYQEQKGLLKDVQSGYYSGHWEQWMTGRQLWIEDRM